MRKAAVINDFVVDASVVLTWAFEDESSPQGDALFVRASHTVLWVPALFPTEVANVLLVSERKRRITASQVSTFLKTLDNLQVSVQPALSSVEHVMTLARSYRLTVYDATYLELALRTGLPLATFDKDLALAAQTAGVLQA